MQYNKSVSVHRDLRTNLQEEDSYYFADKSGRDLNRSDYYEKVSRNTDYQEDHESKKACLPRFFDSSDVDISAMPTRPSLATQSNIEQRKSGENRTTDFSSEMALGGAIIETRSSRPRAGNFRCPGKSSFSASDTTITHMGNYRATNAQLENN
jgi:hypothetical protein